MCVCVCVLKTLLDKEIPIEEVKKSFEPHRTSPVPLRY